MSRRNILALVCLMLLVPSARIAAGPHKTNSSLRLLRALRETPVDKSGLDSEIRAVAGADRVVVTVKFDHVLSGAEIAGYEGLGLSFYYIDGQVARTEAIYPVRVPWERIDEVGERTSVLRMESAWRPSVFPTLDVSGPEIEADSAWANDDPLGLPLTGKGMRIADFDTGIDVFHPSFFYADGDTLEWLDVDLNNLFDPGVDAVDIDKNGVFGAGELLRHVDGWIYDPAHVWGPDNRSNDDYVYQPDWDWLYADVNNNFSRDQGSGSGFAESDPTYGEPWFIALDDNHNNVLDVGEKLVALGTSKIYGAMTGGSVERLRGVDLIDTQKDTNGHGTAVSGVLAGGQVGRHKFAGIAPDAELLAGYFFSGVPISYLIPWARSRGADAMLYEFGGFVWEFLDGSSLDEELVTIEHRTIPQITPSGNLGRGNKHALTVVAAMDSVILNISAQSYGGMLSTLWGTTLWRTEMSDLTFRLTTPLGFTFTLVGGFAAPHSFYIQSYFDTSPRNTHRLDLYIDHNVNTSVNGLWKLTVINNSDEPVEIVSNISDDRSSWAGGAEFTNYASDYKNVTFPATSDSALVNGSYSTRGFEGYEGVGGGSVPAGEISVFSGRGERIDGWSLLDICSPGNYDVYTPRSHADAGGYPAGGYRQFSGTSAAGPHVAAASAIVRQAFPEATIGQIEFLIGSGAATDGFTGAVYNQTWGWGKLRILGALRIAVGVQEMADGKRAPALLLDQNYPNPFNPSTWIPFYLPADGPASVRIYDVKGRLVKTLRERRYNQGPHSVRWDGTDNKGGTVASGVYFCELMQGGERQTRKMTLLR
jgi:subtilisin family serine protease